MTSRTSCAILIAVCASALASCSAVIGGGGPRQPMTNVADKPFASGGSIEIHLDGGSYKIRPAADDHIRVAFGGNVGGATVELTADGTHANVGVKGTPHSNFEANLEVPKTSNLVIRLAAGNFEMDAITGSKDFDSGAGNAEIAVGNANDYSSVDASVQVGNLSGGPFGEAHGTLAKDLTWSGKGTYTLRAKLGAGNLELK